MEIKFYKYQGAGNDFVMIDNRDLNFPKNDNKLVEKLCDRRFGIGGDGLILLENENEYDLRMVYYNSDGFEGSMCGNGGRCFVAFAKDLNLIKSSTKFIAVDGEHYADFDGDLVNLQMGEVNKIDSKSNYTFLNTGSPHHVEFVKGIKDLDVFSKGKEIRYSDLYGKEGSNVNFAEKLNDNTIAVRTYERGVEDETLACGTGVTAVAIAAFENNLVSENKIKIKALGGDLEVSFEKVDSNYKNIFLKGPATFVFEGKFKA